MFDFFKSAKKNTENESVSNNTEETEKISGAEENRLNADEKKNIFTIGLDALKKTVSNTSKILVGNVVDSVKDEDTFSDFVLDDMEDLLIRADLGVNYAGELVDKLRGQDKIKPSEVREYLQKEFLETLKNAGTTDLAYKENDLNIYFITGVNGVGKTTLIGKLAYRFKTEGKKVLVAAADTFRAAAEEQLNIWSERAGAEILRRDKADPASVVYEAIQKAKSENFDVILVDTAGRLQNKFNLMEELSKIKNVIDKNASESLRECMLVLDANTGQNGLQQAKVFAEAVNLTSVALTKLDGSAKGAIVLTIAKELKLPVKLIGVGEQMTDLKDFNSQDYINALFS
jgi:fused signal recognition particle receptor